MTEITTVKRSREPGRIIRRANPDAEILASEWLASLPPAGGDRHRSSRAIAAILAAYRSEDVNWTSVARSLGISRQAVHQIKRRLVAHSPASRAGDYGRRADRIETVSHVVPGTRDVSAIVVTAPAPRGFWARGIAGSPASIPLLDASVLDQRVLELKAQGIANVFVCPAAPRSASETRTLVHEAVINVAGRYRPGSVEEQISAICETSLETSGPVLLLSPFTLRSVSIARLVEAHRTRGAELTLALTLDSTRSLSGVRSDAPQQNFWQVAEHPFASAAFADLASAGVSVWQPTVLRGVCVRQPLVADSDWDSWERGLFRTALALAHTINPYVEYASGPPLSSLEGYLGVTELLVREAAARRARLLMLSPTARVAPGVTFSGPAVVGDHAMLAAGATIVGPAVVGANASIGAGAILRRTVVWPDAIIGESATISNAVIGRAASIGEASTVVGSFVHDRAVVPQGNVIVPGPDTSPDQTSMGGA
jgi:NDP-sugar pyrophosphorylase family protein